MRSCSLFVFAIPLNDALRLARSRSMSFWNKSLPLPSIVIGMAVKASMDPHAILPLIQARQDVISFWKENYALRPAHRRRAPAVL